MICGGVICARDGKLFEKHWFVAGVAFEILVKNRYKASKAFRKYSERANREPNDPNLEQQLAQGKVRGEWRGNWCCSWFGCWSKSHNGQLQINVLRCHKFGSLLLLTKQHQARVTFAFIVYLGCLREFPQVAADAEEEENRQEQRRQYKRRLRYGQIIQVRRWSFSEEKSTHQISDRDMCHKVLWQTERNDFVNWPCCCPETFSSGICSATDFCTSAPRRQVPGTRTTCR